jgi:methylmalonyl-CoA mutase C-terminal domain/subunit
VARPEPGHDTDGGRAPRVLIAKPGLDGHDRGAKVVARSLREAGMDVIYAGLHNTPEEIATLAVDRDVDAIGLSILSGAHAPLVEELTRLLRARGAGHVALFVGGTIPAADVPLLREMGVDAVFTPGARLRDIESRLRASVEQTGKTREHDRGGR